MDGGVIRGKPLGENYQPALADAGTIKKVQIHIAPAPFSAGDRDKSETRDLEARWLLKDAKKNETELVDGTVRG
jgi:hypothetical protein